MLKTSLLAYLWKFMTIKIVYATWIWLIEACLITSVCWYYSVYQVQISMNAILFEDLNFTDSKWNPIMNKTKAEKKDSTIYKFRIKGYNQNDKDN